MTPACPNCGAADAYAYKSRAIFRCRECKRQFSETSGGIWNSPKLAPEVRAEIEALARAGARPVEIMKKTGVSYKTAWAAKRRFANAAS